MNVKMIFLKKFLCTFVFFSRFFSRKFWLSPVGSYEIWAGHLSVGKCCGSPFDNWVRNSRGTATQWHLHWYCHIVYDQIITYTFILFTIRSLRLNKYCLQSDHCVFFDTCLQSDHYVYTDIIYDKIISFILKLFTIKTLRLHLYCIQSDHYVYIDTVYDQILTFTLILFTIRSLHSHWYYLR